MLAQNFKTPAELWLTDAQHWALVLTLGALERGELKHAKIIEYGDHGREFTGHFNMYDWNMREECGTVCCIGGTAELLGGLPIGSLYLEAAHNPAIDDLFAPDNVKPWAGITPDEAAIALRAYLTTGKADWSHCHEQTG